MPEIQWIRRKFHDRTRYEPKAPREWVCEPSLLALADTVGGSPYIALGEDEDIPAARAADIDRRFRALLMERALLVEAADPAGHRHELYLMRREDAGELRRWLAEEIHRARLEALTPDQAGVA